MSLVVGFVSLVNTVLIMLRNGASWEKTPNYQFALTSRNHMCPIGAESDGRDSIGLRAHADDVGIIDLQVDIRACNPNREF